MLSVFNNSIFSQLDDGIANKGKLIAFVGQDDAENVLSVMKKDKYGKDASIIGEVVSDSPGKVFMQTRVGGSRIVGMLVVEKLPRIC
ncbi:MAG: hypothetical protein JRD93_01870 [Deltaproteobacteria bacterium]|nr:hypothetical protein [Deltaproteobacteria bacterium]MBW2660745.1 hypothetical protein [Deltaproteobacteria bacterium]